MTKETPSAIDLREARSTYASQIDRLGKSIPAHERIACLNQLIDDTREAVSDATPSAAVLQHERTMRHLALIDDLFRFYPYADVASVRGVAYEIRQTMNSLVIAALETAPFATIADLDGSMERIVLNRESPKIATAKELIADLLEDKRKGRRVPGSLNVNQLVTDAVDSILDGRMQWAVEEYLTTAATLMVIRRGVNRYARRLGSKTPFIEDLIDDCVTQLQFAGMWISDDDRSTISMALKELLREVLARLLKGEYLCVNYDALTVLFVPPDAMGDAD